MQTVFLLSILSVFAVTAAPLHTMEEASRDQRTNAPLPGDEILAAVNNAIEKKGASVYIDKVSASIRHSIPLESSLKFTLSEQDLRNLKGAVEFLRLYRKEVAEACLKGKMRTLHPATAKFLEFLDLYLKALDGAPLVENGKTIFAMTRKSLVNFHLGVQEFVETKEDYFPESKGILKAETNLVKASELISSTLQVSPQKEDSLSLVNSLGGLPIGEAIALLEKGEETLCHFSTSDVSPPMADLKSLRFYLMKGDTEIPLKEPIEVEAGADLRAAIKVKDDRSGTHWGYLNIKQPAGVPLVEAYRDSINERTGEMHVKIKIGPHQKAGAYAVETVGVMDKAENRMEYKVPEPIVFKVRNKNEDTTPPEVDLKSLRFYLVKDEKEIPLKEPLEIEAGADLRAAIKVKDDRSGTHWGYLNIKNFDVPQIEAYRDSINEKTGEMHVKIKIGPYQKAGDYAVESVGVMDKAENRMEYKVPEPIVFKVRNKNEDTTPPEVDLKSLRFYLVKDEKEIPLKEPLEIEAGADLRAAIKVKDDRSGTHWGYLNIKQPGGVPQIEAYRDSINEKTGDMHVKIKIGPYQKAGDYAVESVGVMDKAENRMEYPLPNPILFRVVSMEAKPLKIEISKVPAPNPTQKTPAASLVSKLGSPEFREREEATRKLSEMGKTAEKEMRAALKSTDPEIARRAHAILETLETRESPASKDSEERAKRASERLKRKGGMKVPSAPTLPEPRP